MFERRFSTLCSFVIILKTSHFMYAVQFFFIIWIMFICVAYTIHLSLFFIIHVFASTDATYYTLQLSQPTSIFKKIYAWNRKFYLYKDEICLDSLYSMSTYKFISTGFCRKLRIYCLTGMEGCVLSVSQKWEFFSAAYHLRKC